MFYGAADIFLTQEKFEILSVLLLKAKVTVFRIWF